MDVTDLGAQNPNTQPPKPTEPPAEGYIWVFEGGQWVQKQKPTAYETGDDGLNTVTTTTNDDGQTVYTSPGGTTVTMDEGLEDAKDSIDNATANTPANNPSDSQPSGDGTYSPEAMTDTDVLSFLALQNAQQAVGTAYADRPQYGMAVRNLGEARGETRDAMARATNAQAYTVNAPQNYGFNAAQGSQIGPVQGATATTADGVQVGQVAGPQTAQAQTSALAGAQQQQIADLQARASGQAPSLADAQMRAAMEANMQANRSMMASQRGGNVGLAARQAAGQTGMANQQAAQQAMMGRLQEQQQAQNALTGALEQARGQDQTLSMANMNAANQMNTVGYQGQLDQSGLQATLNAENNQFNAGAANAADLANLDVRAQLAQRNAELAQNNAQWNAGAENQYNLDYSQQVQDARMFNADARNANQWSSIQGQMTGADAIAAMGQAGANMEMDMRGQQIGTSLDASRIYGNMYSGEMNRQMALEAEERDRRSGLLSTIGGALGTVGGGLAGWYLSGGNPYGAYGGAVAGGKLGSGVGGYLGG